MDFEQLTGKYFLKYRIEIFIKSGIFKICPNFKKIHEIQKSLKNMKNHFSCTFLMCSSSGPRVLLRMQETRFLKNNRKERKIIEC